MKSIMQEASSVIKAIEKGWETAGKPKEFSIKVFEEPKKNFIGMTVLSAKVGIFFDDKKPVSKEVEREKAPYIKKNEHTSKPLPKKETTPKAEPTEFLESKKEAFSQKQDNKDALKNQKIVWAPEMVMFANQWLTETLKQAQLDITPFTIQPSQYHLLIHFKKPLFEQEEKEQQLLRSFSLLLIQTLRHKFKRPLRGFKIIMNRQP